MGCNTSHHDLFLFFRLGAGVLSGSVSNCVPKSGGQDRSRHVCDHTSEIKSTKTNSECGMIDICYSIS